MFGRNIYIYGCMYNSICFKFLLFIICKKIYYFGMKGWGFFCIVIIYSLVYLFFLLLDDRYSIIVVIGFIEFVLLLFLVVLILFLCEIFMSLVSCFMCFIMIVVVVVVLVVCG